RAYEHVIWIWMENHSYHQVIGSGAALYENSLAHQCGSATHYRSVASPSLPNYIGATSGGTHGVMDDGSPATHSLASDNLFREVRASGRSARSYMEDMPAPCALDSHGQYAVKHNPAAYFVGNGHRSACRADDVPVGGTDNGPLA